MAGELTQKETELFYDISSDVEQYDPGIDTFNQIMKRAEIFLNDNGGAESLSYQGTLLQLNEQWEFLDMTAKLSGKVYVLENGIVDVTPDEWNGPFKDDRGTYFVVDGVELISLGIFDARFADPGTVDTDGHLERSVEIAYGFNPEDYESDIPMFFATPDDILHAEYELPTMDAVASRLYRHMPKELAKLDKRIYKAGFDPMKMVAKLQKSIDDMQGLLVGDADLQLSLTRYLVERMELDQSWPYGITIEGPAWYAEDDDPLTPILFKQPSLHFLKSIGASLDEHTQETPKRVGMSLSFAVPTTMTQGEGTDGRLHVPLESIKDMFSTRPMGSIHESFGLARDARDLARSGDASITLPDYDEGRELHPKIMEFRRLEALESLIKEAKKQTMIMRRTRHSTSQDALEMSSNLARWFNDEVLALNLQESDVIRVSGQGVTKANANLRTVRHSPHVEDVHIEVDEDNPVVSPTIAADTMGIYEGVIAEVDRYEGDDDTEFWQVAPKMTMTLNVIQTPLVLENYPLLSAAVKSSAKVRLDDSTEFELPELSRMRERHAALTLLATEQKSSIGLKHVRAVERAFYNESSDTWNEAGPLIKHIRQLSSELMANPDNTLLEAFRQQLLGRRVQIAGNTWFGNGRSDDHMNVGIVNDMFIATLADGSEELVANVAGTTVGSTSPEPDMAALVVLRTVSLLKF